MQINPFALRAVELNESIVSKRGADRGVIACFHFPGVARETAVTYVQRLIREVEPLRGMQEGRDGEQGYALLLYVGGPNGTVRLYHRYWQDEQIRAFLVALKTFIGFYAIPVSS